MNGPDIPVLYFKERDGSIPVLEWVLDLYKRQRKAAAKCVAAILRLMELGHQLRRPEADYLRDGVYELRCRFRRVNYRVLYFFDRKGKPVLVHALTKEAEVPDADVERAIRRKVAFEAPQDILTWKTFLMAKTTDAIRILKHRIRDREFWQTVEEERFNAEIARLIYDARTNAGLTQAQLAQRIGTKQPVIARLEDADYNGHSLRILQRVAKALNLRLNVSFAPAKRKRA